MHLKADGSYRTLEEGGPVLGPLPRSTYERGFVSMKPGELLVFFTDGIVETRRAGSDEELGFERLLERVASERERPAEEIVAAIFAFVAEFSGGAPPEDDRTVVVIKRV